MFLIPDHEADVYGARIVWIRIVFFVLGGCVALTLNALSRGGTDAAINAPTEATLSIPRAASMALPPASAIDADEPTTPAFEPSQRSPRARVVASQRRARRRSAHTGRTDATLVDTSPAGPAAHHAELVQRIEQGEQPGGDRWRTVESMERYVQRSMEDPKERLKVSRCLMAAKLVVDEPASLRSLRRCVDSAFASEETRIVVGVRN